MDKQPTEKQATKKLTSQEIRLQEAKIKEAIIKEYKTQGKKVRVISIDELARFAIRFGRVSQFYFIGAVLMLIAGIHFAQAGSVLLPKIFLGGLVFCVLMTLLSFRMSYKAGKVVAMIGKKMGKK